MPKLTARLTNIQVKNTKPKESLLELQQGEAYFYWIHWIIRAKNDLER